MGWRFTSARIPDYFTEGRWMHHVHEATREPHQHNRGYGWDQRGYERNPTRARDTTRVGKRYAKRIPKKGARQSAKREIRSYQND